MYSFNKHPDIVFGTNNVTVPKNIRLQPEQRFPAHMNVFIGKVLVLTKGTFRTVLTTNTLIRT